MSPLYQVWLPYRHCGWGDITLLVSHKIWEDHVIKVTLWAGAYKVSQHHVKFGGHKHIASREINVFVYHVTLQDHVIKPLCGFLVWSTLRYVTTLPSVVAIGSVVVKI